MGIQQLPGAPESSLKAPEVTGRLFTSNQKSGVICYYREMLIQILEGIH